MHLVEATKKCDERHGREDKKGGPYLPSPMATPMGGEMGDGAVSLMGGDHGNGDVLSFRERKCAGDGNDACDPGSGTCFRCRKIVREQAYANHQQ